MVRWFKGRRIELAPGGGAALRLLLYTKLTFAVWAKWFEFTSVKEKRIDPDFVPSGIDVKFFIFQAEQKTSQQVLLRRTVRSLLRVNSHVSSELHQRLSGSLNKY